MFPVIVTLSFVIFEPDPGSDSSWEALDEESLKTISSITFCSLIGVISKPGSCLIVTIGFLFIFEESGDKFFKLGKHNVVVLLTLGDFCFSFRFEARGRDLRLEMCFLGCDFFWESLWFLFHLMMKKIYAFE